MIRKILIVSISVSAYLAFQRSSFVFCSLTVTLLVGYEQWLRFKYWKQSTKTGLGSLRSQLSNLPYSEVDHNKAFLDIFTTINLGPLRRKIFFDQSTCGSQSLNFKNGLRQTSFFRSNKPNNNKIYLFGGSTLDNLETPDDFTIASQLQKLVFSSATSSHRNYEVINYGICGATLSQNCEHFRRLDLVKGDICLFYFGVNQCPFPKDAYFAKYPISLIPGINRLVLPKRKQRLICLRRLTSQVLSFDRNHSSLHKKVDEVKTLLDSIDEYCIKHEINFIAVLQPFLFTRSLMTKHDKANAAHNFQKSQFGAYLHLYDQFAKSLKNERFFFDGRDIFNQTDLDVYTDWVHTNFLGNKIIADCFYSLIDQQ